MIEKPGVPTSNVFVLPLVTGFGDGSETIFTLDGTHYGKLLLIFRIGGEFDKFQAYAQSMVKGGYTIKSMMVLANDLDEVHATLKERNLLPSEKSRVAVEGDELFDEVIAELMADTIWDEDV